MKETEEVNQSKGIRRQYIKSTGTQARAYSLAVVVDDLKSNIRHVYLGGIGGNGSTVTEQTRSAFSTIKSVLKRAGGSLDDIVTMYVSIPGLNGEKKDEFYAVRREIFGGNNPDNADYPASMLTGTLLVVPQILVEIQCEAEYEIPKQWKIKE